jgi:hypothetical protein
MQLNYFFIADYAAVDAAGKLNVIGAFTTIFAKEFPARHPALHLVVSLSPQLGEFGDTRLLRIVFLSQDAEQLGEFSSEFEISAQTSGLQPDFKAVIGIQGLEFQEPGAYEFRLYVDKDEKGSALIYVKRPEETSVE